MTKPDDTKAPVGEPKVSFAEHLKARKPKASPCTVYARSTAVCSLGTHGCPLHHGR